jgi:hypothetical protein
MQMVQTDHELIGLGLASLVTNAARLLPISQKYNPSDIAPDQWYSAQHILHTLSELAARPGSVVHLVNMGIQFSQVTGSLSGCPKPATMMDMMEDFSAWYRLSQRGTDIGKIRVERAGDKAVRVYLRTPFPDDLCYGILYGYVQCCAPQGTIFRVLYDNAMLNRDFGGETTVVVVSWR